MRICILFNFFLLTVSVINAQLDLKISIGNVYADTIVFGKYFGKRVIKIATINRNSENIYHLKDTLIEPGVYTLIYKRDNTSTDERKTNLLIDESNQKFEIRVNNFFMNNVDFIGSSENIMLRNYQKSMDSIFSVYRKAKDEWIAIEDMPTFQEVVNLEKLIMQQNTLMLNNSTSKVLKSLISNYNVNFPAYNGSLEDQKQQRQKFYSTDFLGMLRLGSKDYQSIEQAIDFFDLYSIYSADGDNKVASERSIGLIKRLIKENKPLTDYYLNYLFNSFPRMTAHGYDAILIDLVNNFLQNGENYQLPIEKIERMRSTALKIKSLLPGEPLPPLTLLKDDKTAQSIQDIKSKYTILVVWSPDCGHCKKELPILKEKFEKYKSKGITVATICSKRGAALSECSSYMTSQNMPNEWLKLNDDNGRSGYVSKLDATSYPAFYLLDEEKKFIMKRKGELTVAEMEKIFKNLE